MSNLASSRAEKPSLPAPEIDCTPKQYSFKELVIIGLKFAACAAILFLPIWFIES